MRRGGLHPAEAYAARGGGREGGVERGHAVLPALHGRAEPLHQPHHRGVVVRQLGLEVSGALTARERRDRLGQELADAAALGVVVHDHDQLGEPGGEQRAVGQADDRLRPVHRDRRRRPRGARAGCRR